jgi:mutator protein MutT
LPSDHETAATTVAIAIVAHNGCYLVGCRAPELPLAGYYEFAGGKCHAGEPLEACVVRECREETGLEIEVVRLRRTVKHAYPYGTLNLHFFDCSIPHNHSHVAPADPFRWVPFSQIRNFTFPDPNVPIINELLEELDRRK